MCLIVMHPAGASRMFRRDAKRAWNSNKDGAGVAWSDGKKLHVSKALTFREFWKNYREVPKEVALMVHFRLATHGVGGVANIHPFRVAQGRGVMAHNGIFSDAFKYSAPSTGPLSDSAIVARGLFELSPRTLMSDEFWPILEEMCGASSKIAILTDTGRWRIAGERNGEWEDGSWYSSKIFLGYSKYYTGYAGSFPKSDRSYSSPRTRIYPKPEESATPAGHDESAHHRNIIRGYYHSDNRPDEYDDEELAAMDLTRNRWDDDDDAELDWETEMEEMLERGRRSAGYGDIEEVEDDGICAAGCESGETLADGFIECSEARDRAQKAIDESDSEDVTDIVRELMEETNRIREEARKRRVAAHRAVIAETAGTARKVKAAPSALPAPKAEPDAT